ncbi:KAP family P-loop NTPase fold protein [Corallococcus exiguus]|uniref:KAP family P-loop NTPase fold protein n=1 Tax=Corallococcus exiguus TaxID=83462 RepID=UPI0014716910|nr:P-loop NTPase fold protein [Corallococcus exiguus]NNB91716.1 AAA family ATPase [Corallococcus exiguus]
MAADVGIAASRGSGGSMLGAFDADRPISAPNEDLLGRDQFARKVAAVLSRNTNDEPIVLGLYGPWGAGKTSIINLVVAELKKSPDVVVVEFNPWFFTGELQLLEKFFEELSVAFGKTTGTVREQVAKALLKYMNALKPAARLLSFGADVAAPGAGVVARTVAEAALPAVEKSLGAIGDVAEMIGRDTSIADVRKSVQEKLRAAKVRVVVMVDDIDRLEPSDVRTVMKLVRLVGDLPCVSYMLSFDPGVVSQALSHGWDDAGGLEKGREYLEKIVQVEIQLPQIQKGDLRRIALVGLDGILKENAVSLVDSDLKRLGSGWSAGIHGGLKTIRQVKRILSSVGFAVGLLKDEVNVVDLILLEAVRISYPAVFDAIRKEPEAVLRVDYFRDPGRGRSGQRREGLIDERLKELGEREREGVASLIELLFPRFDREIDYSGEYDAEWRKEKRIAVQSYLEKALSYGVPNGVISDVQYAEAIKAAEQGGVDRVAGYLNDFSAKIGWADLIWRLREDHSSWSPLAALLVARLIAKSSSKFRGGEAGVLVPTAVNAAFFVSAVLRGDKGKAAGNVASIIQGAESLAFAGMLIQVMEKSGEGLVSEDLKEWEAAVSEAKRGFVDRAGGELDLSEAANGDRFDDALTVAVLFKEWAGQGRLDSEVVGWISRDSTFVRRLLKAVFPYYSYEKFKDSFFWQSEVGERYRRLAGIISPVRIVRALGYGPDDVRGEAFVAEKVLSLVHERQAEALFMNMYWIGLERVGSE